MRRSMAYGGLLVALALAHLSGCRQGSSTYYDPPLSPEAQAAVDALPQDADKYDRILAIANSLQDPGERARRIRNVVLLLAQDGKVERALELARSIDETAQRAEALNMVLQSVAGGGDTETAAEVAAEVEALRATMRGAPPTMPEEEAPPQDDTSSDDG